MPFGTNDEVVGAPKTFGTNDEVISNAPPQEGLLSQLGRGIGRDIDIGKQVLSYPLNVLQQGMQSLGNLPTVAANYVRGAQPGMPNYVEPRFQAGYAPIQLLQPLQPSGLTEGGAGPLGIPPSPNYVSSPSITEKDTPRLFGAYNNFVNLINSAVAPENVLSLPAAFIPGVKVPGVAQPIRPGLAAFSGAQVAEMPQQVQQSLNVLLDPNKSKVEKGAALFNIGAQPALATGMLGESREAPPGPTGVQPEATTPLVQGDPGLPFIMKNRPGIPMPDVAPPFQETPPLIGQRPLNIEQRVVQPNEPLQNIGELLQRAIAQKQEPLGGQVSFNAPAEAEAIPSARQAGFPMPVPQTPEQIQPAIEAPSPAAQGKPLSKLQLSRLRKAVEKGASDDVIKNILRTPEIKLGPGEAGGPPVKYSSGINIDPDDLRPAIKVGSRLLIGEQGETHADVLKRNGIDPDTIPHSDPNRGFVDIKNSDTLISRADAQKASGLTGTANAGGLDSMDLPGAKIAAAMRSAGVGNKEIAQTLTEYNKGSQNALPILRSNIIPETPPSRDIQTVGQEIRQGTSKEGFTREKGQNTLRTTPAIGNFKSLVKQYLPGKEFNFTARKLEDFSIKDLKDTSDMLKQVHEQRLKTTTDPVALDVENSMYDELRARLYQLGENKGENVVGAGVDELTKRRDELQARLSQQTHVPGTQGALTHAEEVMLNKQLTAVNELINKQAPSSNKYYSGLPIFDPEMWGMSKEQVDQMKGKLAAVLSKKGNTEAAKSLKESSPNQFLPASQREANVINNPRARPFEKTRELIPQPGEKLSIGEKAGNFANKVKQAATTADKVVNPQDVIYDWLDGAKADYKGPLMENIRKPLDDDYNDEILLRNEVLDPIRELIKKNKMGTKESQRIGVYMNTLQEGGVQRMVDSGIRPDVIQNIQRTITPVEKQVAQAIRQTIDKLFDPIAKVAKTVDGITLKKIPNYFSWPREWRKYKPEADELATNPNIPKSGATTDDVLWPGLEQQGTPRSLPQSIEKRTPGAKTPIKIDAFEITDRYVRDAAHYIVMRKHLKEMADIVRKPEFAQTYGETGHNLVMENLQSIARQGRYAKNVFLDGLRRLTGKGIIAFRIPSQLVHLSNIPLAMQRTGVWRWNKGLDLALSKEGAEFLKKNFAETFERGGGEPALQEAADTGLGIGSKYQQFAKAGFWLQRGIDRLNAQATVLGVYMRELEKKGLNPDDFATLPVDKDAVRQARVEARRAVASPSYKDVPPILARGGSFVRSILQFQNTFLDQWSNFRHDLINAGIPQAISGNPKLAMQTTAALAAMLMTETAVKYGYKQGLQKATGQQPDDKDTFQKELWREALHRVPGMGQLASELVYDETGIPSVDVALQPIREGKRFLQATDEGGKTIAATRAIGGIGEALGVPGTSQALDVATGIEKGKFYEPHEQRVEEVTGIHPTNFVERLAAEKAYEREKPKESPESKAKGAERAVANEIKRGTDLLDELPRQDKNWLKSRGLTLPGFDNKIDIRGIKVYLTKEEMEQYTQLHREAYSKALAVLKKAYDEMPDDETKAKLMSKLFSTVKAEAKTKMEMEMLKGKQGEKKKRFSVFDYLK